MLLFSRIGLLVGGLFSALFSTTLRAADDYTLLRLENRLVKWGTPQFGAGAVLSYGLARQDQHTPDAINCQQIAAVSDNQQKSGPINRAQFEQELKAAFAMWQSVADVSFRPAKSDEKPDLLIGWQAKPRGYAFTNVAPVKNRDATPPTSRAIGQIGQQVPHKKTSEQSGISPIAQSLICLNPKRQWKIGYDGNHKIYDLRYTLVHEIGHAIGLDHTLDRRQMMHFAYDERRRGLQAGDRAAAVRLYGPPKAAKSKPAAEPVLAEAGLN